MRCVASEDVDGMRLVTSEDVDGMRLVASEGVKHKHQRVHNINATSKQCLPQGDDRLRQSSVDQIIHLTARAQRHTKACVRWFIP